MQNIHVHYFLPWEKWNQTCLVSTRDFFFLNHFILLPNITKVMGSVVHIWLLFSERAWFGICGGDCRGRFQKAVRGICQVTYQYLASYS